MDTYTCNTPVHLGSTFLDPSVTHTRTTTELLNSCTWRTHTLTRAGPGHSTRYGPCTHDVEQLRATKTHRSTTQTHARATQHTRDDAFIPNNIHLVIWTHVSLFCREQKYGHSAKRRFAEGRLRHNKTLGKDILCREPNSRQTVTLVKQIFYRGLNSRHTQTLGKNIFVARHCVALGKEPSPADRPWRPWPLPRAA